MKKKFLIGTIFLSLTCGTATPVFAAEQVFATETLNIRSDASMDSDVVGYLPVGSVATADSLDENGWYHVTSGDCEGYISSVYVTSTPSKGYTVARVHAADGVNVRKSVSKDSEVIDVLEKGEEVELVEGLGSHSFIVTDSGEYGYVDATYVEYHTYYPKAVKLGVSTPVIDDPVIEEIVNYDFVPQEEELSFQEQWESTVEHYMEEGVDNDEVPVYGVDVYAVEEEYDEVDYYEESAEEEYVPEEEEYVETQTYSSSNTGQAIVDEAMSYVGVTPYVWGGTSLTDGADCSGFTQSIFADNGISLNRTAGAQSQGGTDVSMDDLQPGDLLFYSGSGENGIGHVSIYAGNGQVVHASSSTTGTIVSDIDYRTPVSAKRYWE